MEEKNYNIGVEATIDVIGGKWKPIILCHLKHKPQLRPSELSRLMPKITQKMLTQQLKELERNGVIVRTVYKQVPPKVEYSLSEYGRSLSPILEALCEWGEYHAQRETLARRQKITIENREFT